MDLTFYFKILALVTFLSWLFHIFRRLSLWLYFWQLKEYRFDRFLDGIKENKFLLFPRVVIWSLVLLLALIFSLSFEIPHYIFIFLSLLLYVILGLRSLYFFVRKEWNLPKFTSKTIVLFFFSGGGTLFFGFRNSLYFFQSVLSPFNYFLYLFLFEIFFPVFISLLIVLFQIPTFFIKKMIIKNAKEKMKKFKKLLVIGITGSYGKTSTKEFLYKLLSQKYKTYKTPANQNSEIGVAKAVLEDLKEDHQIFICEMGAYRKGEIKAICDIVHPKIGILTGISGQHISLFGNLRNIINTKYELISSLPKDGLAIFNSTNEECQKLAQRTTIKKFIYFVSSAPQSEPRDQKPDVWAQDINETSDFIEFLMKTFKGDERIRLNLLGRYNIENFLGAITCALYLGVSLNTIKKIAPDIKPSETSLRKKGGKNNVTIIDDSYSQNPDGTFSAIDYLKTYKNGKKIVLMPCLIELGKSAPAIHKSIGRMIGKNFDLAIITTPFYFEEIKIGAMESKMLKDKILFSNNPGEISKELRPYLSPGNVILIEGRVPNKIKDFIGIH